MVGVMVRVRLKLENRLAVGELILVMFYWKLVLLLIARVGRLIINGFGSIIIGEHVCRCIMAGKWIRITWWVSKDMVINGGLVMTYF